jgi:non-homologous end joining protein Ku
LGREKEQHVASRSTWRGAIEVLGFPVHIALYSRVRSTRDQGFKRLIGKEPARQAYISDADMKKREAHAKPSSLKFRTYTQAECATGVQVGDAYKVIPETKIEKIKDRDRSRLIEPHSFVPVETVPLELGQSYTVVPDDKVPGSEASCEQLWNALIEKGLAYTSQITTRAGSKDSILVVFAREDGLFAAGLPFDVELADVPTYSFTRDRKVGKRLAGLIAADEDVAIEAGFEHAGYVSTARATRQEAIDAATSGKAIPAAKELPEEPVSKASLMDALEERVSGKAKPKKRSSKKVAA